MGRRWQIAALGGAIVFAIGSLAPVPAEISVSPLDRYGDAVANGDVPYRDFSLEYPPGALPPIVLPALVPGVTYSQAARAFEAMLGVLLVLCTAYLLRDARRSELVVGVGLVALLPLLLGPVVLHRFDLWPALLVSASLVSLRRGRSRLAGAILGFAAAAKAYAAALILPLSSAVDRDEGRRPARTVGAAALVAAAVVTLPFALLAPGGVASSIRRQVDRPLQLESVGASLLLVAGTPEVEFAAGSWSLTGSEARAVGAVSSALGLAGLTALWIASWRYRRHLGSPALSYAACVALILVFAKVASPQYLVWLAPLVAVVRDRVGLLCCVLVAAACVLTQLVYPARYEELVADEALPVTLLVARNCLLVAVAALLVIALSRRLRPLPAG